MYRAYFEKKAIFNADTRLAVGNSPSERTKFISQYDCHPNFPLASHHQGKFVEIDSFVSCHLWHFIDSYMSNQDLHIDVHIYVCVYLRLLNTISV